MTTRVKTIADLLRERRTSASKSAAARTIGVSRQIYLTWESGHALPSEEFIPRIAEWLGVDEEELALQRYREKLERIRDASSENYAGGDIPGYLKVA